MVGRSRSAGNIAIDDAIVHVLADVSAAEGLTVREIAGRLVVRGGVDVAFVGSRLVSISRTGQVVTCAPRNGVRVWAISGGQRARRIEVESLEDVFAAASFRRRQRRRGQAST